MQQQLNFSFIIKASHNYYLMKAYFFNSKYCFLNKNLS